MKNKILPYIILFIALGLSSTAAYYSIIGLSKLFAGVALAVIIMSSFLEASKLVIASLLYQYWDTLNKMLKVYLTLALFTLILITSMGIYGMLSSGYQETYSQLTIKENQTKFLEQKKDFYESDVKRYDESLKTIGTSINNLSTAKSSQIQVRDTSSSTGFRTTISTTELRMAQKRIEVEEQNRQKVQLKREIAADSLQKYQLQILQLENNNEVAGELGPLQYLSGLTGASMDQIINILLLIIIFVFDPLAISLVIASNFAFEQLKPKIKENIYGEKFIDGDLWEEEEEFPEPNEDLKEAAEKYKEIEYDLLDLNKDGIVDKNEINIAKQRLQSLKNQLTKSISSWRRNKILVEINNLIKRLPQDDNETKTY